MTLPHARPGPPSAVADKDVVIGRAEPVSGHGGKVGDDRQKVKRGTASGGTASGGTNGSSKCELSPNGEPDCDLRPANQEPSPAVSATALPLRPNHCRQSVFAIRSSNQVRTSDL